MMYLHLINGSVNLYNALPLRLEEVEPNKWDHVPYTPEGWVEVAQETFDTWAANPTAYVWQADGTLADAPTPQPEETPE